VTTGAYDAFNEEQIGLAAILSEDTRLDRSTDHDRGSDVTDHDRDGDEIDGESLIAEFTKLLVDEYHDALTELMELKGQYGTEFTDALELNAIDLSNEMNEINGLQRNASLPRDFTRLVPKPVVVAVRINGVSCRALIDSGSLGDFMDSKLADQLKIKRVPLAKQIDVHMAAQGSRTR
jgi:hypothetical protein